MAIFSKCLFFRFAKVEDQKDALRLYTVQIPYKRERKPLPCYLTKWDGRSFLPLLTKPCGNEVISCLSVRWGLRDFNIIFDVCCCCCCALMFCQLILFYSVTPEPFLASVLSQDQFLSISHFHCR